MIAIKPEGPYRRSRTGLRVFLASLAVFWTFVAARHLVNGESGWIASAMAIAHVTGLVYL